ncbi:MAG: sarcosine oxidase subunit delta [Betaproteobacteria bacterium]|nr:sarcosine oxidase subunit delta [Betaproteobacteria bacterium]
MMLLPCPYCGPRDVTEFTYGGDDGTVRPGDPQAVSDARWVSYVYIRDNPRGPHDELWQHSAGCRRWIRVRRDTLTHQVLSSAPAAQPVQP